MKKSAMKRLRLNRETLRGLDQENLPGWLRIRGGGTYTQVVEGPGIGFCCSTATSPPQAQSSYCQTATAVCECSTAQG